MLTLRPYQKIIVDRTLSKIDEVTHPLLVVSSVGSGKSVIISEVLLALVAKGWRCLCLTMSSTLIRQNHETYQLQGGKGGIYCAALNTKETTNPVIFGTPNSVLSDIKKKKDISRCPFNIIIVDECHNISPQQSETMYMRVLNHFGLMAQANQYNYRILGLTGTPYRGKNTSIVGENQLFKERICNISASWLIERNYLTKPVFQMPRVDSLNFSALKVNSMGKFNQKELADVIKISHRATANIMAYLVSVIDSGRNGAFIFASTLQHCKECMAVLPPEESACITGATPGPERECILNDARAGRINYLVNVATLLTGIDCPRFDVICFVRPTESAVLFTQAMGRGLRLYPEKRDCLVLDFAENIQRFQDWEDPILTQALATTRDFEAELIFECPTCSTMNSEYARRCSGFANQKRCDFYFEFKDCPHCQKPNDITARACTHCKGELIDPNSRLTFAQANLPMQCPVLKSQYWVVNNPGKLAFHGLHHVLKPGGYKDTVRESYLLQTEYHKNIFYGKFVRESVKEPSRYYPNLLKGACVESMLEDINPPHRVTISKSGGNYRLLKKHFDGAF